MPAVVVSSPSRAVRVSSPYSYHRGYGAYSYPYYSSSYYGAYPYSSAYYGAYPYSSAYYGAYPYYNNAYAYSYPYAYAAAPVYQAPVVVAASAAPAAIVVAPAYGSCKATTGVGVTSSNCASGKMAVAQPNNGCMCVDQTTGMSGCENVTNGICK